MFLATAIFDRQIGFAFDSASCVDPCLGTVAISFRDHGRFRCSSRMEDTTRPLIKRTISGAGSTNGEQPSSPGICRDRLSHECQHKVSSASITLVISRRPTRMEAKRISFVDAYVAIKKN
jgi:hypothetical protein